jgi:hypothetical protein
MFQQVVVGNQLMRLTRGMLTEDHCGMRVVLIGLNVVFSVLVAGLMDVHAQAKPDFSGTWTLNVQRTLTLQRPWNKPMPAAGTLHITQTAIDIIIDAGEQHLAYKLDSSESATDDEGAGTSPDWRRTRKTQASWAGEKLILMTRVDLEQIDNKTGKPTTSIGNATVQTLTRSGDELIVEQTGFRAVAPEILHGHPFEAADDPPVTRATAVYVKTSP